MTYPTKAELRKEMRQTRNLYSNIYRREHALTICKEVWGFILSNKVKTIHSYIPLDFEVDILPLLEKLLENGIQLVVPQTLPKFSLRHLKVGSLKKLKTGLFNTRYPADGEVYRGGYDLILVPGLCFDRAGNRLGYGKGYYDRFLALHSNVTKAGVCFPFQMIESIPEESHDIQMDMVFSGA